MVMFDLVERDTSAVRNGQRVVVDNIVAQNLTLAEAERLQRTAFIGTRRVTSGSVRSGIVGARSQFTRKPLQEKLRVKIQQKRFERIKRIQKVGGKLSASDVRFVQTVEAARPPPPKGTLFQVTPVKLRIGDIIKKQRQQTRQETRLQQRQKTRLQQFARFDLDIPLEVPKVIKGFVPIKPLSKEEQKRRIKEATVVLFPSKKGRELPPFFPRLFPVRVAPPLTEFTQFVKPRSEIKKETRFEPIKPLSKEEQKRRIKEATVVLPKPIPKFIIEQIRKTFREFPRAKEVTLEARGQKFTFIPGPTKEVTVQQFTPGGAIGPVGFVHPLAALNIAFERGEGKAKRLQREKKIAQSILLQTAIFGGSIVKGAVFDFPVSVLTGKIFKDISKAVTKPREAFGGLGTKLRLRPASTIGGFIGFQKGLGVATRIVTKAAIKPRVKKMAAVSDFKKAPRPKGFKIAAEREPILQALRRTPEEIRISEQQVREPRVNIIETVRPKKPIEVTISDTGKVIIKGTRPKTPTPKPSVTPRETFPVVVTPKTAARGFTRLAVEGVLGKTTFSRISGVFKAPKGPSKRLGQIFGREQRQVLLLEEQFAGPVRGVVKEAPKLEVIFPSATRIRTVQIGRAAVTPISILRLQTLPQTQAGLFREQRIIQELRLKPVTTQLSLLTPITQVKTRQLTKKITLQRLRSLTRPETITRTETLTRLEPITRTETSTMLKHLIATETLQRLEQ